jgi:ATP-dependent Clp protease ATP-binding subunit ClpC
MFERFTEPARRALFFSRYEVSQWGAPVIGPEHLFLGLLRENRDVLAQVSNLPVAALDQLRGNIETALPFGKGYSTGVEIPFSPAVQRIFRAAVEEADRLRHPDIGPEHLLLALLREDGSAPASGLTALGVTLEAARTIVAAAPPRPAPPHSWALQTIEDVNMLVDDLANLRADAAAERAALVKRIRRALESLKMHFHG